jgi:hypothetical protein
MIEYKRELWEWIDKNLDHAIDQAKNRNPILCKFIRFYQHEDNPNNVPSNKDQELLDNLKLPDFIEKE